MLFILIQSISSLDNGLALTPPMGWMAWEQFRCEVDCEKNPTTCISENLFVEMIDRLVADGWLEAGYDSINIDDCWAAMDRDANGELYANKTRFPHGIAWLASYAHKRGVRLGIYNDYGTLTCEGYPGSEGSLRQDALTFARWEVDMLKMDGCYSNELDQNDGYPAMAHFLNKTGRPIMYSCSWPAYQMDMNYAPLPEHCNLWRNFFDIAPTWGSVLGIIDKWGSTPEWARYAGPGHWNDPDQLMIGLRGGQLNEDESKTQFAIWAIVAAPIIMSNDLRNIEPWAKEILLNSEVIAVSQDRLGKQGFRITPESENRAVWYRELENGEFAVALMNRGNTASDISVNFGDFTSTNTWKLRDLYEHKDLGSFTGSYTAKNIPAHSTVIIRLTK